jgi:hypothetical protein
VIAMTDRRLILTGGALSALLTALHFVAPLGFGPELEGVSQDMRAVVYELAYGFAVLFALMAYVSLRHTSELLSTKLGHALLAGFTLFWVARAVEGPAFGETNAYPISVMCLVAAALYGTPLFRIARRHRPQPPTQTTERLPKAHAAP